MEMFSAAELEILGEVNCKHVFILQEKGHVSNDVVSKKSSN